MDARLGVGQKMLQVVTRMSMSLGARPAAPMHRKNKVVNMPFWTGNGKRVVAVSMYSQCNPCRPKKVIAYLFAAVEKAKNVSGVLPASKQQVHNARQR